MKIIITCEHGGNKVPLRFKDLFAGKERLLNSHRGYDRYALTSARHFTRKLKAPLFYSIVTRLLIDLNRSPHHPKRFSVNSKHLSSRERIEVIEEYYLPYRNAVESAVNDAVKMGVIILHVSVHSFAPIIDGRKQNADIGLLYDPARFPEKQLCLQWQKQIRETNHNLKVRRNYPYLGKADGLVTCLRRRFQPDLYIGVELEINQKIMRSEKQQASIHNMLVSTLKKVIG